MDSADDVSLILRQVKGIVKHWGEAGFVPPVLRKDIAALMKEASAGKSPSMQEVELKTARSSCNPVRYAEARAADLPSTDLTSLRRSVEGCVKCRLSEGRKHIVFGEGNPSARLVFVGEGPGRKEDETGRPFVGEAGSLLTKIIENGMRIRREDVYICNVVKCRPPDNRIPERDEMDACLPYLLAQLRAVRPEVICVLGQTAGRGLFGDSFRIGRVRGKWISYEGIPVMATYHPAYLLRNPKDKGIVWEDIKLVMAKLGLGGGDHDRS